MLSNFITRPILSLVISLFILLLGLLALLSLPVTQFPDIVPPCVTVTAKYTGANAEVCTKAVATPLERAINGVPGMTYMTSVSSNNGITMIQIYFKTGIDPDLAAVNVQNRVSTVIDELPEEVIKAGITTEKEVNSMLLYLNVFSNDSSTSEKFVYNFADINILQELKRIDGVGFCEIMGSREYSMRVWLKPDRMVAYNISTDDVIKSIQSQNLEAAPGKTGENSGKGSQELQYVLKYTGKYNNTDQYKNIILRSNPDGSSIRLKEIADIEFGVLDYGMISKTNGKPSASIMIKQRPGSNAKEVIENIKEKMEDLKKGSFPPGMTYSYSYDVSRFLDASISEVIKTLMEAFILVFIVVYIFLQDFRSTLITALSVPVSLIGTFFLMSLLDFSINLLTLFAIVLAIGIVVDNAIVVVEAVHAEMEEKKVNAKEATLKVMKEMSRAIFSITLVMSAVFIPAAFMSGPAGIFYRQFSLTLAIAIVLSGINALTLTPALCALWLKNAHTRKKSWMRYFFYSFNKSYAKIERRFMRWTSKLVVRRIIMLTIITIFGTATYLISNVLPTGFIPSEDQGLIYVSITTPSGATVERTAEVLNKIEKSIKVFSEIESFSSLAGYSILTEAAGASYGMGMINLKPWHARKQTAQSLIKILEEKTRSIQGAKVEFFLPPTVPGFGNAGGFELRVLDKNKSSDYIKTAKVVNDFLKKAKEMPEVGALFSSFDVSFPQYLIHLDPEKAAQKGVRPDNVMSSLQTYLGSYYASNFIRFGQMYKVMVQADPAFRKTPEDVSNLFVKNDKDEMVSVSSFLKLERVYGPEQLTRYNMYTSALLNGNPSPDYSSSKAIEKIEELSENTLPKGFHIEWSGITREEIISGNQAIYIFVISLIFVYLLLAAQYESLLLPFAVLLSLPAGIFGALAGLYLLNLENNIYAQVALIMLIGLLGKNAILIVEYAIQKKNQGYSISEAAIQGAVSRLRPIIMTSLAFIVGLIPLCISTGAGAIGNRSIGTASAFGMFVGTACGLLIIPGLFYLFSSFNRNKSKEMRPHSTVKELNTQEK